MFPIAPNSEFVTEGNPEDVAQRHEVILASKLLALEYLRYPEYDGDWVAEGLGMVVSNPENSFDEDYRSKTMKAHDGLIAQLSLQVLFDLAIYANLMHSHGLLTEAQKKSIMSYKGLIEEFLTDYPEAQLNFC